MAFIQSEERVDLKANKKEYVKKMHRQLKEAEAAVAQLRKTIDARSADENAAVQNAFAAVQSQLASVHQRFGVLKDQPDETWAEQSESVSTAYKQLDSQIADLRTKVKPN
jgi:hypothetical protein